MQGSNEAKCMIDEETRKKLEEILGEMTCPKDFGCMDAGFDYICRSQKIGVKKYLLCLEEDTGDCKFRFMVGNDSCCRCPLRVYIVNNFNK